MSLLLEIATIGFDDRSGDGFIHGDAGELVIDVGAFVAFRVFMDANDIIHAFGTVDIEFL